MVVSIGHRASLIGTRTTGAPAGRELTRGGEEPEPRQVSRDLLTAVTRSPVTWLHAPTAVTDHLIADLSRELGEAVVMNAGPPACEWSAFGQPRRLIHAILPLVLAALPEAIDLYAPELTAIVPAAADTVCAGRPRLGEVMQLPLGFARVLPRESELVFRVASCIGWLLQGVSRHQESTQDGLPLFVFPRLDEADWPTLVTVYHLCSRARAGGLRLLLAAAPDPGSARRDLFDSGFERWALCRSVHDGARALDVELDVAESTQLPEPEPGTPLPWQRDGDMDACSTAADDPDSWRAAIASRLRWFSPEAVLDLARQAPPAVPATEVWQAAGTAHAMIGNFPEARHCFGEAEGTADSAEMRARMAMYLGLLGAKRTGELAEAGNHVERGLDTLAGMTGPAIDLERGWLLNVKALLAYRAGRNGAALNLTRTALALVRPYQDVEAIGLKTNLVANTSIVLEKIGRTERALLTWRRFLKLATSVHAVFAKSYYFRESGLKASINAAEALVGYQRVFELADELGDTVMALAAARAVSRLAADAQDAAAARAWAERIPGLADRLGDVEGLAPAWLWLAVCRATCCDPAGADEAAGNGLRYARLLGSFELTARAEAAVCALKAGRHPDPEPWRPALPPSTPRQPADLFLPSK